MSSFLLGVVAVIYLGVAYGYFSKQDYGMCMAFLAYAISNVGFIIANSK